MHELSHLSTRKEGRPPELAAATRDLVRQGQDMSFQLTVSTAGIIVLASLLI